MEYLQITLSILYSFFPIIFQEENYTNLLYDIKKNDSDL